LAQNRDQKKHNPDNSGIPTQNGTQQTVTSSGSEKITETAPKIQMRTHDSEQTVVISNARQQDHCGKERKRLKKICRGLVDAICEAVKRWNILFAAAGSAAIATLPTDEM